MLTPEQIEKLRDYAIWVLSYHPDGDIDGGELQDISHEMGLLEKFEVTEPCGSNCRCVDYGFPCDCYRPAGWLDWPVWTQEMRDKAKQDAAEIWEQIKPEEATDATG